MANWTNNVFIDALLLGSKYDTNTLNYQFTSSVGSEWTDTEKTSFIHATNSWSDVANINFSNNASSYAELVEDIYTDDPNNLGAHDVTSNYFSPSIVTHSSQLVGVYNINGDGWDRHDSNGGLSVGGYGYITFVHELGHALGLDHTHADDPAHDPHVFPGVSTAYNDFGTHQLNQNIFSVMSYNTELVLNDGFDLSFGYIAGPMAFDIAAIQYLYGINPAHNNSNTTYTLPDENRHNTYFSSIWDTGGIDEIVYHGAKDINIDLRSATLQNEEGGGGFISSAEDVFGGFTIAGDFTNSLDNRGSETGVVIENAISGSGNDTITGNGANNQINAGKGNDAMRGGGGSDVFIFDLDWGNDQIFDFDHNDKIDFSALSEIAQLNDLTIDYSNNKTLISTVNSSDTLELVSSTLTLSRANFIFSAEEEEKEENNTITANKIIAGLYIAAFERAPDQEGLIFWENEANNNIASGSSAENVYKDQIMKGFVTHPVFANTYNHLDNATFVDSIYQNILGQAGDSIGQAFWESTLNTGLSRSDMIVDFVQGTFEFNPTNPLFSELSTAEIQTANERQSLLNNKVEAALYFVDILKTNTYIFNNPPENDNAYLASIKVIEDITHDSSTLINAKAVIDLAKDETNPMTYIINQPSEALTRNKIFNNIENNELIGIVPVEDDLYFL